jgi:hypothetical protein
MWHSLAFVRTVVSEEHGTTIIGVKRISELGTTLAVTSNWILLRRNSDTEAQFYQEPHGVTSQKTTFWILFRLQVVCNSMDP